MTYSKEQYDDDMKEIQAVLMDKFRHTSPGDSHFLGYVLLAVLNDRLSNFNSYTEVK